MTVETATVEMATVEMVRRQAERHATATTFNVTLLVYVLGIAYRSQVLGALYAIPPNGEYCHTS